MMTAREGIKIVRQYYKEKALGLHQEKAPPKIKQKRKPYDWGAKEYLTSLKVGEIREYNGEYDLSSLRPMASRLKREFGSVILFYTKNNKQFITRVE